MELATYGDATFHLPYTERLYLGVSPDHQWIAWTWFGVREYADVYVAPTDGTSAPTAFWNPHGCGDVTL